MIEIDLAGVLQADDLALANRVDKVVTWVSYAMHRAQYMQSRL